MHRGDIVTTGKASATERRMSYLHLLRGQGTACHAEPHGEAPGLLRRQKQEPVSVSTLNASGGLLTIGVVSSHLIAGPGMT